MQEKNCQKFIIDDECCICHGRLHVPSCAIRGIQSSQCSVMRVGQHEAVEHDTRDLGASCRAAEACGPRGGEPGREATDGGAWTPPHQYSHEMVFSVLGDSAEPLVVQVWTNNGKHCTVLHSLTQ